MKVMLTRTSYHGKLHSLWCDSIGDLLVADATPQVPAVPRHFQVRLGFADRKAEWSLILSQRAVKHTIKRMLILATRAGIFDGDDVAELTALMLRGEPADDDARAQTEDGPAERA